MERNNEIVIDVWGRDACFTRPEAKVERISYPVPTPSACRGILESIFAKPGVFWYEIRKIEVMNPIRFRSDRCSEIKSKASYYRGDIKPIVTTENRTLRTTIHLVDVYYRIHAVIHRNECCRQSTGQLVKQFNNRVKYGKCFRQPCFGLSEYICFFDVPDYTKQPIEEDLDIGTMLYDVFDIRKNIPVDTLNGTGSTSISFYHAVMKKGVIEIPEYKDPKIRKPEEI